METTCTLPAPEIPASACFFDGSGYSLNENYLSQLGFSKLEPGREQHPLRYRYYCNRQDQGFELAFCARYNILSVTEFMHDPETGEWIYSNTVVGMFHIGSDDDLRFIFLRNVRLNFVFHTSRKKLYGF